MYILLSYRWKYLFQHMASYYYTGVVFGNISLVVFYTVLKKLTSTVFRQCGDYFLSDLG